ncbi:MAG TPA: hypothetical protein VFS43_26855 [Polyangiaceae bacterium]|nr:hypothetical protein [Polyangiaceae bacterium]
MSNRTLHRRMLRTLALSLVAASHILMPQFATPAQAGNKRRELHPGDTVKLKTTWGDGYVLNFGGTEGYDDPFAKIHWNTSWDLPNRFEVSTPHTEGLNWRMLKNRWSGKCLAAKQVLNHGSVTQETCNSADATQFWAGQWGAGESAWFRNLAHYRAGLNTVMTQMDGPFVGSPVTMETLIPEYNTQEWFVETCLVNGVEQQYC